MSLQLFVLQLVHASIKKVTTADHLWGESTGVCGFHAQRASNTEITSIIQLVQANAKGNTHTDLCEEIPRMTSGIPAQSPVSMENVSA